MLSFVWGWGGGLGVWAFEVRAKTSIFNPRPEEVWGLIYRKIYENLPLFLENPDPREDLKSRSPNLRPYTTKGSL